MSSVDTSKLQALGSGTVYEYEGADSKLLERFESPFASILRRHLSQGSLQIKAPEFTSLCPLTGQPDFATIVIDYTPDAWCVESKSLKLYLGSFRNVGEFHESCVARIARDLIELLNPSQLMVRGEFTPRGGIPFWPTVHYFGGEAPLEVGPSALGPGPIKAGGTD